MSFPEVTAANVAEVLRMTLRSKLMKKSKFLSIATVGFGFCSIIFGWDQQDMDSPKELVICNEENGYRDLIAVPDLSSFRRIPWENNVPFFVVRFLDPDTREPVCACSRGLLKNATAKVEAAGYRAMAGGVFYDNPPFSSEYKFCHFRIPGDRFSPERAPSGIPSFLQNNSVDSLPSLNRGEDYHDSIFDACEQFHCDTEEWSAKALPALLKLYAVKAYGIKHGVIPCFMAKPRHGLPGNGGYMNISLITTDGQNAFTRDIPDPSPYPDRLVEDFSAPNTVSWGLEHRAESIQLITPATANANTTRFEIRVPGADANPHFVLAAIIALGWFGVEKKLEIPVPPLPKGEDMSGASVKSMPLAKSLKEVVTKFTRPDSVAREVFGDSFVEHFGGTREHEIRLWEEAVTDWEVRRYIETV
ncbi:hypothetical protein BDV34DRAFT_210652 [Aspergillus parasiticus]|uniref:GS catalytic domain-containing protein n=1 Tax=Aspergillus parasiticus TaxID=5067 RepID=A0A5N6DV45_ASPPA|nr:hypothetical protein BDV34DRAFT_210652 [Aspergillus parasiticus]